MVMATQELVKPRTATALTRGCDASLAAFPTADLPAELMSIILEDIMPPFKPNSRMDTHTFKQIRETMHNLAQLRLINKSWYHSVTPILYSTFILSTGDREVERRFQGVNYHPHLIRTVILYGEEPANRKEMRNLLLKYLGSFLTGCTNIQRFEIIEPQLSLGLLSKSTLEKVFRVSGLSPVPSLSVRSTTYRSLETSLQYAFRILGDIMKELQELEIHCGSRMLKVLTFAFPRNLPYLKSLSVVGFDFTILPKVLSRIGQRNRVNGGEGSGTFHLSHPLRHLSVGWLHSDKGLLECLAINNIASHLTSLHILGLGSMYSDPDITSRPIKLLEACPRLKEFIFFYTATPEYLSHIPSTLESLGVFMTEMHGVHPLLLLCFPTQLLPFVNEGNKRRNVKKLVVGWRAQSRPENMQQEIEVLEDACRSAGVRVEHKFYEELARKWY